MNEVFKKFFICEKISGGVFKLKYNKQSKPIVIRLNELFNEDYARLSGLMPDGSLIKDLMRIYFSQKKDLSKIDLFAKLITNLFLPENKVLYKPDTGGGMQSYINSQTLARFFYHIIGIPKSDEQMRVPYWVFESPKKVKIAYLQEVFAMEGTILKKLYEIRLITKDKLFAYDLKRLLKSLYIDSHIGTRLGGTHRTLQYRLSIYNKNNFVKFKEIGFNDITHKDRFNQLLRKYKIAEISGGWI